MEDPIEDAKGRMPSVLYVGLQKTGSTFLRHYFYQHPDVECTRSGALLQTDACDVARVGLAQAQAAYAEALPPAGAPLRIDMYESLAMGYLLRGVDAWEAHTFVTPVSGLAHPSVVYDPGALARRLAAIVPGARILLTIRSQPAWLDSAYRHFHDHLPAARRRFVDFLATLEGRIALDVAHYDRTVSVWEAAFGEGRVHVLPLESLERDEAGALERLCAFLGVDAVPYDPERKERNRGRALASEPAPLPPRSRTWFARFGRTLVGEPRGDENGISRGAVPDEIVETLRAVYSASNARLAQRLDRDLATLGYPS